MVGAFFRSRMMAASEAAVRTLRTSAPVVWAARVVPSAPALERPEAVIVLPDRDVAMMISSSIRSRNSCW
jgi:hypothetical protein